MEGWPDHQGKDKGEHGAGQRLRSKGWRNGPTVDLGEENRKEIETGRDLDGPIASREDEAQREKERERDTETEWERAEPVTRTEAGESRGGDMPRVPEKE
ncbi:hypothetical protein HPG69_007321 [Diceros bicornis minor]|uniref:Uncharacterized protein n=1 Tax=Diceros bicornis minor TaxID=77932 RepID=A0A7J7F0D0_DICBM|nr:hypothetical protein HPG69_007321 [Diceros bicornis minor]